MHRPQKVQSECSMSWKNCGVRTDSNPRMAKSIAWKPATSSQALTHFAHRMHLSRLRA